jgi:hypothetical protein
MDEWRIVNKIAELKSYIASDWPTLQERKSLYLSLKELEAALEQNGKEAEENKKA